jgi:hypothetical protein
MTALHKLLREGNILIRGIIDERFPRLELLIAASPKSEEDHRTAVILCQFDLPVGKSTYIGYDPISANYQIAYDRHLMKCDWTKDGETVPILFTKRQEGQHILVSPNEPAIRESLCYILGHLENATSYNVDKLEMNNVLSTQLSDYLCNP